MVKNRTTEGTKTSGKDKIRYKGKEGKRIKVERKETNLQELAGWDTNTRAAFDDLLLKLETTPATRSLLTSMIKFENMYQPLNENPLGLNLTGNLNTINEIRREQRTRAYLHQKDLIKTVGESGEKILILTTRAHKIFYQRFPLAQLRKEKWDGRWTLVAYDFPETMRVTRNYLRDRLLDFGFGQAQESLLLTPLPISQPIQELLEGDKIAAYAWVLTAERVLGLSDREVAEKAWDLEQFNYLYQKLLDVLPQIRNSDKLKDQWRRHFLAVFLEDPYLPQELLPRDWVGEICQKECWKLGLPKLLRLLLR